MVAASSFSRPSGPTRLRQRANVRISRIVSAHFVGS
jgi:hypothetical protein